MGCQILAVNKETGKTAVEATGQAIRFKMIGWCGENIESSFVRRL